LKKISLMVNVVIFLVSWMLLIEDLVSKRSGYVTTNIINEKNI